MPLQVLDARQVNFFALVGTLVRAIEVAVVAPGASALEGHSARRQETAERGPCLQIAGNFRLVGHPAPAFFRSASLEGSFGTVKKTRTFRLAHLGHLRTSGSRRIGKRSPRVHTSVVKSNSTVVSHQRTSRSDRFAGPNHEQRAVHRQPSFHTSPNVSTGMRSRSVQARQPIEQNRN